ncbi:hypothetical protein ACJRO7_033607 [Eucalyptus globulus]|uniref:PGG domain-containing protein n=1 Tax=Eucalyptus globulus TaxID=34317 RepID=A0ABD3JN30_EUCGL
MAELLQGEGEDPGMRMYYAQLAEDPHILEPRNEMPYANTLLHEYAGAGETLVAMEIATLRPSLARRLNNSGLSPMHLALQNRDDLALRDRLDKTVRALMTVDVDLIRVKGRGRLTPLHYAAKIDADELLAEFLSACQSSIEDLTSRCETAVHVAVKHGSSRSVKVLVGWLVRVKMEEILNWKDEDGNTVLHIATRRNRPQVIKSLIGRVNVNAKNFGGFTALDLCDPSHDSNEVRRILRNANAKETSDPRRVTTLSDHLSQELGFSELQDRFFNVLGNGSNTKSPRDMILVVAGLVVAATYQAVLSPPGGYWQDNYSPSTNMTTATAGSEVGPHSAGEMIMSGTSLYLFLGYNTVAFLTSACTILVILLGLPSTLMLRLSVSFLLMNYYTSLISSFPSVTQRDAYPFVAILGYILVVAGFWVPEYMFSQHDKRHRLIDTPKRSVGNSVIG